ncbi:MAG: HNH endonuclease [Arcobacteraceae bacterium]|nr:HNH endonuclease [Arcobacteraceae bacterium]
MKLITGQLAQEQVFNLSNEAIKRGFRIEDGLVVKYRLDNNGKKIRKRNNWKNNIRGKARQHIQNRCENCNSKKKLSVHHIVYLCHGGRSNRDNCMTLCYECHKQVHQNKLKIEIPKFNKPKEEISILKLEKGLWGEYRIID